MPAAKRPTARRPLKHDATISVESGPAAVPVAVPPGPAAVAGNPEPAATPASVAPAGSTDLIDLDDTLDDLALSISPTEEVAASRDEDWEDVADPLPGVDANDFGETAVGEKDLSTIDSEINGLGYTDLSPLALSLLNAVDSPLTPSRQLACSIDSSGPYSSQKMTDNAKYWVDTADEVVVMRFPCLVDTGVAGVKTGKYFDLYGEDITDDKFKKLRAIFGFRSLPDDPDTYPAEVLKAASSAQKLLYKLQTRNESLAFGRQEEYTVKGFFKADTASDCFQYLIRSDPIFTPAPDPTGAGSGVPVIDLTGDDSDDDSSDDRIFSSPSKLRAQAALKTPAPNAAIITPTRGGKGKTSNELTLGDWAQPRYLTSRYYYYVGDRTHLWASKFNVPEIRDGNGVLVHPTKWDETLTHLAPVTVDVILKLWDIPPNRIQRREGSRIYQLVLRRVQLHPTNSLSNSILKTPSSKDKGKGKGKGKKRVNTAGGSDEEYAVPPSPTKKSKARAPSAAEDDFVMAM